MIAIIGGGASGMFAAVCAALQNPKIKIKIIERMDRVGKKLLATGNGRCNFTNINFSESNFHSGDNEVAWNIVKAFPPESVINFFCYLGILSSIDSDGRVFPYSYQASAVLDCLRFTLLKYNVEIVTDTEISQIEKKNGEFLLYSADKRVLTAKKVIIASGGASYKSLGSNGSGFNLLRQQGHTITKISPVLTQIKTEEGKTKSLDGIKLTAKLSVSYNGERNEKIVFSQQGDVLFTKNGLSGPPAFSASACLHEYGNKDLTAHLDFMPDYELQQITSLLHERVLKLKHLPMEDFFTGMLNKRVGMLILKQSGVEKLSVKPDGLTDKVLKRISEQIKDFKLKITGSLGYETSQATAGGAILREFDPFTLESKIITGLYASGEVLDVYGDCGGYNLHWAWASGRIAGYSAAGFPLNARMNMQV